MAKPIIDRDAESLDNSHMRADDYREMIERRKNALISSASTEAIRSIEGDIDAWVNRFAAATDFEQVGIIAEVYNRIKGYERACGRLFDIVETSIARGKKAGYSSLKQWFDDHLKGLGMTQTEAYRYLAIYRVIDDSTFEKIGPTKAYTIASAGSDRVQAKLLKAIDTDPTISVKALEQKKKELLSTEKGKERQVVAAQKEEAREEVKISVIKAGVDSVLLKVNRDYLPDLLDLLNSEVDRLKLKTYDIHHEKRKGLPK